MILWPLGVGIALLVITYDGWLILRSAKPEKSHIHVNSAPITGEVRPHSSKSYVFSSMASVYLIIAVSVLLLVVDSGIYSYNNASTNGIINQLKQRRDLKPAVALAVLVGLAVINIFLIEIKHMNIDQYGLKIYAKRLFFPPKIICDSPWENLSTVHVQQKISRSYIQFQGGVKKSYDLPSYFFADPCWLNYITTTCINLANTEQRHHFLTHLHDYVPTQGKIVTK